MSTTTGNTRFWIDRSPRSGLRRFDDSASIFVGGYLAMSAESRAENRVLLYWCAGILAVVFLIFA